MAKSTTGHLGVKPNAVDAVLIDLSADILSEFFFGPDNEDSYRQALSALRSGDADRYILNTETIRLQEGDCSVSIEVLRTPASFAVSVRHPAFSSIVEGLWDFEQEELRKPAIVARNGSAKSIRRGAEAISDAMEGPDLDEAELRDLMALLEEGGEELPRIGDDPSEPPEATPIERDRVKAIARRMTRSRDGSPNAEDADWLEQLPQMLPVIVDLLIAEAGGKKRNDKLVDVYQSMLEHQLEFVRYRQDAGWGWADRMLADYQQRLIAVAGAQSIPQADWMGMATALSIARVPVSEDMQIALAGAGFDTLEAPEPSDSMLDALRAVLDQMAAMVSSPQDVVEGLKGSAAMMPAAMRGFIATELALSPHPVLRDSVPLMLLDENSTVRRDTALALEQSARPDTLSPDGLRRIITVRNWVPPVDRPALDSAIRKARTAGVEIGSWPEPKATLEFHATMIDGSGAQSVLAVDRAGKTGLFAGLLLRHGAGIADAWGDDNLPRRDVVAMMRDATMQGVFVRVSKGFVDAVVQHALGTAVEGGGVPAGGLLTFAELAGGSDWKDRRLDIAEEADRMWRSLPPTARSADARETAFTRGLVWMKKDPIIASWFEDGPHIRAALAGFSRSDKSGMMGKVLREVLPATRALWAERFTLMAMWCEAALDAKYHDRAKDLIPVACALSLDTPMEDIPVMQTIAMQTVTAAVAGGW